MRRAVPLARKCRQALKASQRDLREEIIRRQEEKLVQKDQTCRRIMGTRLKKKGLTKFLEEEEGVAITSEDRKLLEDILDGNLVGRTLVHYWDIQNRRVLFTGVMQRVMANKRYKVSRWSI
jgi:hypothetical protein